MSIISNDNVGVGATTAAADVNTKFSDVATATAATRINEDNLRTEAVDRRNITSYQTLVKSAYVDNQNGSTIGDFQYTGKNGSNEFALDHDGTTGAADGLEIDWDPVDLVANDLLRIHYTVHFEEVDGTGWGTYTPAVGALGLACMVAFPVWDVGAGYTNLPGNADFMQTLLSAQGIRIEETGSSWRTKGFAVHSIVGRAAGSNVYSYERTMHGCFNYVHTGATVNIDKIRINARGFMAFGADATGRYLAWADLTNTHGKTADYTFGRGQLAAMILRGDT